MRDLPVISLLSLAGCATNVVQQEQSILRPEMEVLHIDGTLEPVAFTIDPTKVGSEFREACQTNDPMPVALHGGPVSTTPRSTMPNAGAASAGRMPNACPVTAPQTIKTVITRLPGANEPDPAATPSEPQP